jgi:hypothetical protein
LRPIHNEEHQREPFAQKFYVIASVMRQTRAARLSISFRIGMEGTMRKVLGLVGATLLIAGPALAADLGKPVYKAPPLAPVFSWTGFYVGGHVGGAWNNKDWFFPGPGTSTSHNASSFMGGAQGGYNYQVGSWVFGRVMAPGLA